MAGLKKARGVAENQAKQAAKRNAPQQGYQTRVMAPAQPVHQESSGQAPVNPFVMTTGDMTAGDTGKP